MKFLIDFLRQEVPKSGKGMPAYYRKALSVSGILIAAYFLLSDVLIAFVTGGWEWVPALLFIVTAGGLLNIDRIGPRGNLLLFTLVCCGWCGWYIYKLGWSTGCQHLLVPIFAMVFFNVYEPPWSKVLYFLALLLYRIALFAFSLRHAPVAQLGSRSSVVMQISNSVLPLVMLSLDFIIFSSSIQQSERELIIHNQELHREAGTDPLTGLPNRRALLDTIDAFRKENAYEPFCLAIADIDFFKKVNDNYGHACGDYTLKELAALFTRSAGTDYAVCRWGGEEFCFFLPRKNLDQAGAVLHEINHAVRKMPLRFGETDFSITITIGVDEYDFKSSIEDTIENADQKLYMGKINGRDQVVI